MRSDAAAAEFDRQLRASRASRIAAARAATEIDRTGHIVFEGCASFGEFGERHGLSAGEAFALLALGAALERWPELEAQVLSGQVPEESASRMGMLTRNAAFVRPDDDWVAWARSEPTKAFTRRVKQRVEAARRSGAPTVEKTFFVSEGGAERFERARVLASRKADRVLTEGEALEVVTDHYLDAEDPLRRPPRARRLPDTASLPDRRALPAEVVRQVMARNGDRCAVPFCTNTVFLEHSHRIAHAQGGSREARNIDRLCPPHHDLWHAGELLVEGTTDAPVFRTRDGRPLDARSGTPIAGPTANGRDPPAGAAETAARDRDPPPDAVPRVERLARDPTDGAATAAARAPDPPRPP